MHLFITLHLKDKEEVLVNNRRCIVTATFWVNISFACFFFCTRDNCYYYEILIPYLGGCMLLVLQRRNKHFSILMQLYQSCYYSAKKLLLQPNLHVEVFNPSDPLERKGAAASKRIELGLTLLIHEKKWTRRGGTLVQYDARREGEWADRVCVQQKERTVRCLLWRP